MCRDSNVDDSRIPPGRTSEPDQISRAITFLTSEDAIVITGVILPLDGAPISRSTWSNFSVGLST